MAGWVPYHWEEGRGEVRFQRSAGPGESGVNDGGQECPSHSSHALLLLSPWGWPRAPLGQAPYSLLPSAGVALGNVRAKPASWWYRESLQGPGGNKLEPQIGFPALQSLLSDLGSNLSKLWLLLLCHPAGCGEFL